MVKQIKSSKSGSGWGGFGMKMLGKLAGYGSKAVGFMRSPTGKLLLDGIKTAFPEHEDKIQSTYTMGIGLNKGLQNFTRTMNGGDNSLHNMNKSKLDKSKKVVKTPGYTPGKYDAYPHKDNIRIGERYDEPGAYKPNLGTIVRNMPKRDQQPSLERRKPQQKEKEPGTAF
jgi:hypothetical protein